MISILLITLFFILKFVASEDVRSLCDDPNINAADRLPNNTYRVYRGNQYWQLQGLPSRKAKVEGPFPIWYQFMAPFDSETSVQTVVTGAADGTTWKYKGQKLWMYNKEGTLISGGKPGFEWNLSPKGGFNAVLNDGGMGGFGYPVMIGFSGIRVYYYNTKETEFQRIGSPIGYIGGKDGEKFPTDLTAAFAFPSSDKGIKYYVYLFKRKKHCFRPIIGEEECKEWRDNKELFGCSDSSNAGPTSASGNSSDSRNQETMGPNAERNGAPNAEPSHTPEAAQERRNTSEVKGIPGLATTLLLIIIYFKLI